MYNITNSKAKLQTFQNCPKTTMGKTTNADKIISRRKSPRTVKRAPKRHTDDGKPKSTPTEKKRHSLDSDDIRINAPKRKPAPKPICTPTTVAKPKGTPKSSPFTIQDGEPQSLNTNSTVSCP